MARRQRNKRERSIYSYRRQAGIKSPRQSILLVCEGKETEPRYFYSLRAKLNLVTVELHVEPNAGAPISNVDKAIELRDLRKEQVKRGNTFLPEFDEVWCIFDVENPGDNKSFYRAVDKAHGNQILLGVSNPSFEVWYLLHFIYTNKPFTNADQVIAELANYINGYQKNMDVFPQLFELTDKAIEHAKRCYENNVDDNEFPNSSTKVHLLVEKINLMRNY